MTNMSKVYVFCLYTRLGLGDCFRRTDPGLFGGCSLKCDNVTSVSDRKSTALGLHVTVNIGPQKTINCRMPLGSSPEGVVVDAMAKLLFYTDNGRNTINVARTENSRDRRIIVTYAKHPRTIPVSYTHLTLPTILRV